MTHVLFDSLFLEVSSPNSSRLTRARLCTSDNIKFSSSASIEESLSPKLDKEEESDDDDARDDRADAETNVGNWTD